MWTALMQLVCFLQLLVLAESAFSRAFWHMIPPHVVCKLYKHFKLCKPMRIHDKYLGTCERQHTNQIPNLMQQSFKEKLLPLKVWHACPCTYIYIYIYIYIDLLWLKYRKCKTCHKIAYTSLWFFMLYSDVYTNNTKLFNMYMHNIQCSIQCHIQFLLSVLIMSVRIYI